MTGNDEVRRRRFRWITGMVLLMPAILVSLVPAPLFFAWIILGAAWVQKARTPGSQGAPLEGARRWAPYLAGAINGGVLFFQQIGSATGGDTTGPGAVFVTVVLLAFAIGVAWITGFAMSRITQALRVR